MNPSFPGLALQSCSAALCLAAVTVLLAPVALYLYLYPYVEATLSFRNLRGPVPDSYFFGSLRSLGYTPLETRYSTLAKTYGPTFRLRGVLGNWRIASIDPVAVSYVLRHTGQFHRNAAFNGLMHRIVGEGVLAVEGETHRRQRRILNSAFNGKSVNNMLPMFWEKAYVLKSAMDKHTREDGADKGVVIDMLQAFINTALDIVGRAGFNYDFDSHMDGSNPLGEALNEMVNCMLENRTMSLLQSVMPAVLDLPTRNNKTTVQSRSVLDSIGQRIVSSRKEEIRREHINLEKEEYEGKDAISLCLRANLIAAERDRMSDAEVLGQIGTLMLAGNETSAMALCWATLHLIENPTMQLRLREELLAVPYDEPTAEMLHALPYLDKFVRELLRFDPPLPQVVRTAVVDCIVPLGEPVLGRDGSLITELPVKKGTDFVVAINNINRLPDVWGPHPEVFNPDRFDDPAIPYAQIPGVWGGLMTFIGGPHNCLGFRFAVLEIKAVLFVLLRNFSFRPPPNKPVVARVSSSIIQRPLVIGEEDKGMQMPALVGALDRQ